MTMTTPPVTSLPAPRNVSTLRPAGPGVSQAHVITTDARALAVVTSVARLIAHGAAERDAHRTLPFEQLDVLSGSGLLAVTVPRVHGGAEVSATTLLEVFRRLAVADSNVAQIPLSHVVYLNVLRRHGTPDQRRTFFAEALAGKRFANAQAEPGATDPLEIRTRLRANGSSYLLRGVKGYTTGALFAHWLGVLARDDEDRLQVAYVPADAPGVTVTDDWEGMGQRTTASGTVQLDDVPVPAGHVVAHHRTFEAPQLHGALAQVLHAAIDAGIAEAALTDAVELVRTRSRPSSDAGATAAVDDPLTAQRVGELIVQVRSAEAVLAEAGRALDSARVALAGNPRDDDAAATVARGRLRPGGYLGGRAGDVERALRGRGRARRPIRSGCTGTGAMPVPIRCTTLCGGRSSTSAATP